MTKPENNKFEFHHLREPIGYWHNSLNEMDCDYWSNICHEHKKTNPNKISRSTAYGYQSKNTIHTLPEFFPLINLLIKEISLVSPNLNNKIHGMWLNILSKGSFNRPHTHKIQNYDTSYSGVLYVKTPPNSGNIVFLDPLDLNAYKVIETKSKDILLFNNIIPHYVEPNQLNEDRISIAFNYV